MESATRVHMTSHELARRLFELDDLPVVQHTSVGPCEVTGVAIPEEAFDWLNADDFTRSWEPCILLQIPI